MPSNDDFIVAIKAGDAARVAALLDGDASLLTSRDGNGYSAVTLASYYGHSHVVDVLRAHGMPLDIFEAAIVGAGDRITECLRIDPDGARSFSHDGWTALHLAAHFGRRDAVGLLLAAGSDPNAVSQNETATRPLISAAAGRDSGEKLAAIEALIAGGADVNGTDTGGHIALHIAAMDGSVALVELLLEAGADVSARSADGKTALSIAREQGKTDIAALLEGLGAAE